MSLERLKDAFEKTELKRFNIHAELNSALSKRLCSNNKKNKKDKTN